MNTLEIIAELRQNKVVPRLDGDRLKLIGETGNLSKECIEQIRTQKSQLIAFLRSAEDQFDFASIRAVPVQEIIPSPMHKRDYGYYVSLMVVTQPTIL